MPMRYLLSTVVCFTLTASLALAQPLTAPSSPPSAATLRLVPSPQQATRTDGTFKISADTPVILESAENADDHFAAQQLVDEIKASLNVSLSQGGGGTTEAPSI